MSIYALKEHQKQNWRNLGTQFLFWAFIYGVFRLYGVWHEQEGIIKTDDCRTHVQLSGPSDPRAWLHKFTCELSYDADTRRKAGECSAVELDQGTCIEHLYYFKR
jgi:hypothetical protein